MSKDDELILVVPREALTQNQTQGLGLFQGFCGKEETEKHLRSAFGDGGEGQKPSCRFVRRGPAETDPSLKQIIPYCILSQGQGQERKFLTYERGKAGGEKRLQSLRSLGVGGHVNPVDAESSEAEASKLSIDILEQGIRRELAEELVLPAGEITFETLGMINDDSNPVGEVHLGLVLLVHLGEGEILPNEDALTNLEMAGIEQLKSEKAKFETWSQIVIEHLGS
jgi:predicted NUDIX family phosphoesterase